MRSIFDHCFIILAICASVISQNSLVTLIEDIKNDGYRFEYHEVLTDDGFYLSLFRIRSNKTGSKWPPVLIVHGLGGSAANFILKVEGKSSAYLLADEGFDVWLLNCRGNDFSRRHKTLKPTDSEFWNHTWHEIGIYDLPSTIDYILNSTGFNKLAYIGLSQGTTAFFVMLSERPEYNDKILAHIAYSPAVFICQTTNAVLITGGLPEFFGLFTELFTNIGYFNLAPSLMNLVNLAVEICNCDGRICLVCQHIGYAFVDMQRFENLRVDSFIRYLQYIPAGAPAKSFVHYAQGIHSCKFQQYQHSRFETPKEYNLNNIKVPLFIFYGENDNLINPKDTMRFRSLVPNGFNETYVIKDYGHVDALMAYDAKEKVYDQTIDILKRITQF